MTEQKAMIEDLAASRDKPLTSAFLTEPFSAGRSAPRLLFDFGVMASLLNPALWEAAVLDFGAGTGWVTEFCARMGLRTVAFDIHGDLRCCLEARVQADGRIDPGLLGFAHGDGHSMPFDSATFGHIVCFDTLHHMHDYPKAFSEFCRVLLPGGRAIFVEPGARHSSSPETIAFVQAQKEHDPSWIERDVVLEEMDAIAKQAGFTAGIRVVPMPHPLALQTYSMEAWARFRDGDVMERLRLTDQLATLNYWDRVIFFAEKL